MMMMNSKIVTFGGNEQIIIGRNCRLVKIKVSTKKGLENQGNDTHLFVHIYMSSI